MGSEQTLFSGEPVATVCLGPRSAEPTADTPLDRHRVLHVINGEHFSGAERVQDLLAARLPDQGFDVGFACLKRGRFQETRQSRQAPLHETEMRSRFDLSVARTIARLAKLHGYELLHAHTPRAALVTRVASHLTGLPMVYHVHSPTLRDSADGFRNRINSYVERWSLARAQALVAVSHSLGRHMRALGFAAERIKVVPNGVPRANVRRNDRLPQAPWTIGTVALFRPRKGLEVLLDAMADVRSKGVPLRLRAIGPFETDDYETQIRQRTERLGLSDAIEWAGFTSDIGAELTRLDLFVLPSLFGEGLPMVVLEAMAAGLPVIGTRVEGVPEAVDHGVTGLLADPGDASDLADCMVRLVRGELDWRSLQECAIRRHAETFSDSAMADGLAQVYRSVLSRSAVNRSALGKCDTPNQ